MQIEAISRVRARDQVRDALRQLIISGAVRPAEKLDEIHLSRRIGASRTPVREALIALEEEGLVLSRPNRGFIVAALDETLVRETYAILGALESAAVEAGGDVLVSQAVRLATLNDRLASETRPSRRHALDREFHRALSTPCGNGRLLQLLTTHWNQAQRVDGGEKRGLANLTGSCAEHTSIVSAITAHDLDRAAKLVRAHWRSGVDVVIRWMRERT